MTDQEKDLYQERSNFKTLKKYYSIKEQINDEAIKKIANFSLAKSISDVLKKGEDKELENSRLDALKMCLNNIKKEKNLTIELNEMKKQSRILKLKK